jgi:hypothetical protein
MHTYFDQLGFMMGDFLENIYMQACIMGQK